MWRTRCCINLVMQCFLHGPFKAFWGSNRRYNAAKWRLHSDKYGVRRWRRAARGNHRNTEKVGRGVKTWCLRNRGVITYRWIALTKISLDLCFACHNTHSISRYDDFGDDHQKNSTNFSWFRYQNRITGLAMGTKSIAWEFRESSFRC